MASETFEYRYFVAAPAETVYAHLADPASYVGLSPLVVEVSGVEHSTDAEGHAVVRYQSVERFRFLGVIRYDNRIRVTMTLTQPQRQIISDVDSPMQVRLRFVFDLQPENGGTQVRETVTAQMPSPLRGFVVSEAQRVQRARAEILKTRLEAAR
jgi:hypothetical protein